jgi:hypothetical protein
MPSDAGRVFGRWTVIPRALQGQRAGVSLPVFMRHGEARPVLHVE